MQDSNKVKDSSDNRLNTMDVYIGSRIKLRRHILGLSQKQLGQRLGLTFQQIQKYEKGVNRVGASRLWDVSRVLGVSMDFFFLNADDKKNAFSSFQKEQIVPMLHEEHQNVYLDLRKRREAIELVNAYYKIKDRKQARHLFELIVSLAQENQDNDNDTQKES